MPEIGFDFRQRNRVFLACEADGVAVATGPGCASDPVNVVRGILRQIEVEHVTDVRDVQPAGCNIGCNQYSEIAVVEVTEELEPLVLRHITRKRLGV